MITSPKALSLLAFFATSSFAASVPFHKRQSAPSNFKLYAYAAGYDDVTIGGFPVFYADGLAYAGNSSALTGAKEVVGVNLTSNEAGVWTATPDTKTNITWASKVLYISDTTGEVGFTDKTNSTSGVITSGFQLYDQNAIVTLPDRIESEFNVHETDIENVWTVGWGSADDDDSLTAVQLRGVAPTQEPAVEE